MTDPTEYIRDMMGDVLFNTLQPINPEGVRLGDTGYLDRFSDDDFGQHYVVRGQDIYGRLFCSFRVVMSNNDEEHKFIYTVFQRFSDNPRKFVLCKSHYSDSKQYCFERLVNSGSARIDEEGYELLQRIFTNYNEGNEGEEYTITDYDGVETHYTVKLYNE